MNGGAPLALDVSIERETRTRPLFGFALLALLGVVAGFWWRVAPTAPRSATAP